MANIHADQPGVGHIGVVWLVVDMQLPRLSRQFGREGRCQVRRSGSFHSARLFVDAQDETTLSEIGRMSARRKQNMGEPLTHFAADETAWILSAREFVWAGAFGGATPGAQKAAFDVWVKKIAAAIRRSHAHIATPVSDLSEDAAWARLQAYAKDVENTFDAAGQRLLPNMFSVSIGNLRAQCRATHPSHLNADVATRALAACRADKASTLRRSISAFNRLIRERNRHPAIADLIPSVPIGKLPGLRDHPVDWSRFDASFLSSRDRAIKIAIRNDKRQKDRFGGKLGADPLRGRKRYRAGRKRSVRNADAARKRHLNALSWLVRYAFPDREEAYQLVCIEDLVTVDTVEHATVRYVARAKASNVLLNADKTSSGSSILSYLETLARRNDWSEDVIYALEDARFDRVDSFQTREMSVDREAFVKLVERDP